MAFIRDEILKSKTIFSDITSIYRNVATSLYKGFLPDSVLNVEDEAPELYYMQGFHEYKTYPGNSQLGVETKRKSLQMPYTASNHLTKLILAEGYEFKIENDNDSKKLDFYKELLRYNNWEELEQDNVELMIGTGDKMNSFYRVGNKIMFNYVPSNRFEITDWTNSTTTATVIITEKKVTEKGKATYYYMLEYHHNKVNIIQEVATTQYVIDREIYKGKERNNINEFCKWNKYARLFDAKLEEQETFDGLDVPMFVFTKTPIKNNKDFYSPRGISPTINALDVLYSLDSAYDANYTEIDFTRFQIAVPDEMLEEVMQEDGKTNKRYNTRKAMYTGLGQYGEYQFEPKIINPDIRQTAYTEKINMDLDLTATKYGVTPGSYRFDGKSIMTATQVTSEKEASQRTRVDYGATIVKKWREFFYNISKYAKHWGMIDWELNLDDIVIKLEDSVIIDDQVRFDRTMKGVEIGLVPKEIARQTEFGADDTEAKEWEVMIQKEQNDISTVDLFNEDDEE